MVGAYILAAILVSPALIGMGWYGHHTGRRGFMPRFWFIALLVFLSLPIPSSRWSFLALGTAWALGYGWGARSTAHIEARTRRNTRSLRKAIERKELEFHFQPIVDIETGVPVAAEVLVRWRQADGSLRGPGPWLDTILGTPSLSDPFHDLMWATVGVFVGLFPHIRVTINTSPIRIEEPGWGELVLARCDRLGIPPGQITVEVVEGALLADTPGVRRNIETVRAAGMKVALDDFGEGTANMVTFMTFQDLVDVVKIDQKLVRHEDVRAAAALIYLARAFGKPIVAEGVETEAQESTMRTLGAGQVQGWLHSKAIPIQDFREYAMRAGAFGNLEADA